MNCYECGQEISEEESLMENNNVFCNECYQKNQPESFGKADHDYDLYREEV
jgi:NMD protein affecting ribosome stability and mRNA decay